MLKELEQHYLLLMQLRDVLIKEQRVLKRGTQEDILMFVKEKEAVALQLNNAQVQEMLAQGHSLDASQEVQRIKNKCLGLYQELSDLNQENEALTQFAIHFSKERMNFYASKTRQSSTGYGRHGQYAKPGNVGSAILSREL